MSKKESKKTGTEMVPKAPARKKAAASNPNALANVPSSIAFSHDKPWHGFGSEIEPGDSLQDVMVRAGLDFKVGLSPIAYGFRSRLEGETDEQFLENAGNTDYITLDRKALHRTDDGTLFDVPRTGYHPIQNSDIVSLFEQYVQAGNMRIETMGSFQHGLKNWLLADMDQGFDAGSKHGSSSDVVLGKILFYFSFVYGEGAFHKTTSISVVCSNTLEAAKRQKSQKYNLWHNTEWNAERAKQATLNLDRSREEFLRLKEDAEILVDLRLALPEARSVASIIVGDPTRELADQPRSFGKVMELYQGAGRGMALTTREGTGWGMLNAVTEFTDWSYGNKRTSQEARLNRAWLGQGNTTKNNAREVLLDVASGELKIDQLVEKYAVELAA